MRVWESELACWIWVPPGLCICANVSAVSGFEEGKASTRRPNNPCDYTCEILVSRAKGWLHYDAVCFVLFSGWGVWNWRMLLLRCGCPHSGTIILNTLFLRKGGQFVCPAREILLDNHNISYHISVL